MSLTNSFVKCDFNTMAETQRNSKKGNPNGKFDLEKSQKRYLIRGLAVAPLLPFLYLQGQYVKLKVGRLPDAGGDNFGEVGERSGTLNLLAIGESTVAGIGAKNHSEAFTGQFAKHLGKSLNRKVKWHAFGVSGITVRRTIRETVPKLPDEKMDVIVIALGANDVFAVAGPKKWRRDIAELINIIMKKYPHAEIFLANVPMIRDFLALPNPLRYVLSRLAKLNHFNTIDLISEFENVYYFENVSKVDDDFFCADGVHPSVKGYDLWTEELVRDFLSKSQKFS